MLSVCTKGLRVTQFQFSVCMYGTCGRIDKADFDYSNNLPSILNLNVLPESAASFFQECYVILHIKRYV